MPLKETMHQMKELLEHLSKSLEKATRGNRAAAQRVRTGSITFARMAKLFRKESVAAEKGLKKPKKSSKKLKKS